MQAGEPPTNTQMAMNSSMSSVATFQYNPSSRPLFGCMPAANSPSRKPKLSLNTTCQPRTLGRGSTGLRLDTLNVTSPTSQNTYRNVYESPISTPSLESDSGSASTPFPRSEPSHATNKLLAFAATPTTPTSTVSNSSTPFSLALPYEQPANLRSILRNRPGSLSSISSRKKLQPRRRKASLLPRPGTALAQDKTLDMAMAEEEHVERSLQQLPKNKRVCFQQPLCVEIETSVYVLRHSDLPSRSPSPSPILLSAQDEDEDEQTSSQRPSSSSSTSTSSTNDSSADSSPDTPVPTATHFRKREREWVWTLGPVNRVPNDLSQLNDVDVDLDDDASAAARDGDDHDRDDRGPAPKKSMLDIDLADRGQ